MSSEFSDLLRSGLRGVKCCHKCNSFNGNRARSCKNTKCNAVFLAGFEKQKSQSHSVKLCTNISSSIYSVRVRDKGPDYRGFVILKNGGLPVSQISSPDTCHIECCAHHTKRIIKDDVFHTAPHKNDCVHIQAARGHYIDAEPLYIATNTVKLLNISQEIKDEILEMKIHNNYPLIQRVSKTSMVVKCKVTKRNPLGYLHILFVSSKTTSQRFKCTCELFAPKLSKKKKSAIEKKNSPEKSILGLYNDDDDLNNTVNIKKCIHFYMCIAAFIFNTKYYEEFQCFVNIVVSHEKRKMLVFAEKDDNSITEKDPTLLSITSPQENFIELAEDISNSQELNENALSPFVTQVIELPNGNGHMIELHAELHSNELQNDNYSDSCGYELKDIVVYKTNNNIVKTCDVLLANSADNVISPKKCPIDKSEPLDIQIMVSDSGDIINLSNIIVDSKDQINLSNIIVDSKDQINLSNIIIDSKDQIKENNNSSPMNITTNNIDINHSEFWKDEKGLAVESNEFIDIQELSVQKNHSDHVYTIAGDDCSLKIISLEQYDSLFGKKDTENISDPHIATRYHFMHNDVLVGSTVQKKETAAEKSNLYNDNTLTSSDSDEEMFFLTADNSDEVTNQSDISIESILHKNAQQNKSILQVKNITRKRKKSSGANNYSNPMLSDYSNFQNIPVVNADNNYVCNDLPIEFCDTPFDNNRIYELNASSEYSEASAVKNSDECDDILLKKPQRYSKIKKKDVIEEPKVLYESDANFAFRQWLSSVTENINQTMHYQFSGKPDALVFHIPQLFFECLQERINMGALKKRLPNHTSVFVRKDAVPLGKFTKYTWNIINIFHLKKILDTSDIQLEITRFFKQNLDGTFSHVDTISSAESSPVKSTKLRKGSPKKPVKNSSNGTTANIKSGSLITYLKVGYTEPNQNIPTPFCIEWIPNLLPKTKIGELRLMFQYGHKTNYVPQDSAARVVYKIITL